MNPLNLYKYLPYFLRKRFSGKYIIIESDDWGMKGSLDERGVKYCMKKYGKTNCSRWTTDSLETAEDLTLLFELIDSYRSSFNKPPIITANFITHNIDYNKSNDLSFVPLSQTLSNNVSINELYHQGIDNKILCPQLHGYCHFDINKLSNYFNTDEGRKLFAIGFLTGLSTIKGSLNLFKSELMRYDNNIKVNLKIALKEFQKIFKYKPISMIPPHFILNRKIVKFLKQLDILSIQASNRLVNNNNNRYRKLFFRKSEGLLWIPRNARLDPHPDYNFFSDYCLNDINKAFVANIPAVIDFHRVNISGRFNLKYRDKSLNELDKVFSTIKRNWPETQFISTPELIKLCQA